MLLFRTALLKATTRLEEVYSKSTSSAFKDFLQAVAMQMSGTTITISRSSFLHNLAGPSIQIALLVDFLGNELQNVGNRTNNKYLFLVDNNTVIAYNYGGINVSAFNTYGEISEE